MHCHDIFLEHTSNAVHYSLTRLLREKEMQSMLEVSTQSLGAGLSMLVLNSCVSGLLIKFIPCDDDTFL